jgi:hypothetical protein
MNSIRPSVQGNGSSAAASPTRLGFAAERSSVCLLDCAAPLHQLRYCNRRKLVLVQRSPVTTALVPCGNYHHSVEDYKWWARLLAACLKVSWAELPPDATLRVTAFCLDEISINKAEQRFFGRLRRRRLAFAWFRQWISPGQGRHLHLAVRTSGAFDPADVGQLWMESLPSGATGSTYAAPIKSIIGLARYLTADCAKRVVLPPPEMRFIFYARRDFLVRPLKQLKQEVRAQWRARWSAGNNDPLERNTL